MGLGIPKQQHIRMQLKFFKHFLSLENITKKYLKFILRQSLFCHPAVCFTSTTQSSFYCFCVNLKLKCHLHQASAHLHMHALCGDKKVFWGHSSCLWSQSPILFTFSILCVTPARVTIVLISSRPSWRRRACLGPCGFGLVDYTEQRRTIYFDVHSFYMCHTCKRYLHFWKGKAGLQWSLFSLSFICRLCQQAAVETAGTGSLFCFDNLPDWVTALFLRYVLLC